MNELQLLALDVLMLNARRIAGANPTDLTDRMWQRAVRLAEVALTTNEEN